MKARLMVLAILLVAPPVTAQTIPPVPIHGHPQLAAYTDLSQLITPSGQCHFDQKGAPIPLGSMLSSHIHVDVKTFLYATNHGELIHVWGTVKAFMLDGRIGELFGELLTNVVWADTGTATPPVMTGDPAGLKTWSFQADIDPRLPSAKPSGFWFHDHGWSWARVAVTAALNNSHQTNIYDNIFIPFWSEIDPTQPITPVRTGFGPILETECDVYNDLDDYNTPGFMPLGNNLTEADDYVPLLPIDKPWTVPMSFFSYQADTRLSETFSGSVDQIHDMDFHHGVLGTNFFHADGLMSETARTAAGDFFGGRLMVLDPTVLGGAGTHLVMSAWSQPNPTLGEQMSAILVIPVTVGASVPPPPPPPPLPSICTAGGQVTGTSSDGGKTFTITSGPVWGPCK